MIITIDGPSGTGKTTVARLVAQRLHFVYFDTGAMYRAITWLVLQKQIDIKDPLAVQECLHAFEYKIDEKGEQKHYFVGSTDVTEAIRSTAVTKFVSAVSALKQVRDFLLEFQYQFAKSQDAVFEGRDLGTVVFPSAELKIFLTADPKIRAERRVKQNGTSPLEVEQMVKDLMDRDAYDSNREIAPLRRAADAIEIDTTHFSIDQVVDQIVDAFSKRFPEKKV